VVVTREHVSGGPEKGRFCSFSEQNCFVGDSHMCLFYEVILAAEDIQDKRVVAGDY
jgi:hypothetical protein